MTARRDDADRPTGDTNGRRPNTAVSDIDLGSPDGATVEAARARDAAERDVEAALSAAPDAEREARAKKPRSVKAPSTTGDEPTGGRKPQPKATTPRPDPAADAKAVEEQAGAEGGAARPVPAAVGQEASNAEAADMAEQGGSGEVRIRAAAPAAGLFEGPAGEEVDSRLESSADDRAPEEVPADERESDAGGLQRVLADVLAAEPPVGDGVARVYRRADRMRRRRLRRVVVAGVAAAAVVAGFGYVLATAAVPGARQPSAARPAVGAPPVVDPLLVALDPILAGNGLKAVPKEPGRGPGWRQYAVADRTSGRPRGLVEVAVYAAPDGLCFPVRNEPGACARALSRGDNAEYARYTDDRDVDWQVHQAIARRLSDGRVFAVMATGERGTGSRADGRPPLSAAEVADVAVDVRVMSAFDPEEECTAPDAACPVLKVPVPTG